MESFMKRLPPYIGKEIFSFLIPKYSDIIFRHGGRKYQNGSYSPKYEIAYIGNQIVKNCEGLYLSRICKKNGKLRYYITEELIDEIEIEQYDRCINIYCYDYSSKYLGRNLEFALFSVLLRF